MCWSTPIELAIIVGGVGYRIPPQQLSQGRLHGVDGDDAEVDALRAELVARIRSNPVREWSPGLLRAVIAVIDLGVSGGDDLVSDGVGSGSGRGRLRLVR